MGISLEETETKELPPRRLNGAILPLRGNICLRICGVCKKREDKPTGRMGPGRSARDGRPVRAGLAKEPDVRVQAGAGNGGNSGFPVIAASMAVTIGSVRGVSVSVLKLFTNTLMPYP